MRSIEVEELAHWRASGKNFVLLDVREPFELQRCAIPGAVHVPMRSVPSRLAELDPRGVIAVLCHHGGRSEQVARFLHARGFEEVYNVEGGIDAYARRVDPAMPTY